MENVFNRIQRCNLYTLPNCVVLVNLNNALIIHQENFTLKFTEKTKEELQMGMHVINRDLVNQIPMLGCIGMISLLSGWFIIIITERKLVGMIDGDEVYLISKVHLQAVPSITSVDLTDDEKQHQKNHLSSLQNFLQESAFYYSKFELSQSYQRRSELPISTSETWMRLDQRFIWNFNLMKQFIDNHISHWVIPVIDGYICIEHFTINNKEIDYVLISRRDCSRTGARFHMRGANTTGDVANFVETEQIIICTGPPRLSSSLNQQEETRQKDISSFVQTRGSIPILWSQWSPKSIKPKPRLISSPFNRKAFVSHLTKQLNLYGKQILLSLIDQRGSEKDIGDEYENQVRLFDHPDVTYIAFDFHQECRNNNYAQIDFLIEKISMDLEGYGFYLRLGDEITLRQVGTVRTNCIDCLDRTNVVQSRVARHMLLLQLISMSVLYPNSTSLPPGLLSVFNNIWGDNANTLSKRYTGVGALKTEYTKKGKRSTRGAMKDGVKSVTRIYQNAFYDDEKQFATNLFLGMFTLERSELYLKEKEGTVRFVVKTNSKSKDRKVILEIDSRTGSMTVHLMDTCITKSFSLFDLKQIYRSFDNYNVVSMVFESTSTESNFHLTSPDQRETFYFCVLQIKNSLIPPLSPKNLSSGSNPNLFSIIPNTMNDQHPKLGSNSSPRLNTFNVDSEKHVVNNNVNNNNNNNNNNNANNNRIIMGNARSRSADNNDIYSSNESKSNTTLKSSIYSSNSSISSSNSSLYNSSGSSGSNEVSPTQCINFEEFDIFIGNCDYNLTDDTNVTDFEQSIPFNKSIYVIGIQNCTYGGVKGYYMEGVKHWMNLLQKYLGPFYAMVASLTYFKVSIIILARIDIFFSICNIQKTKIIMGEMQEDCIPKRSASRPRSVLSVFKSSDGSDTSTPDTKDSNEVVGGAIGFHINNLSFCFMCVRRCDLPYKVIGLDVVNEFNYSFFFGPLNSEVIVSRPFSWMTIANSREGSIILHKPVNEDYLQFQSTPTITYSAAIQISVLMKIHTLNLIAHRLDQKVYIVFENIQVKINRRLDVKPPDVFFVIQHLSLSHSLTSSVKKRSLLPEWDERMIVRFVIPDLLYLRSLYLFFELYDYDSSAVKIGTGVIPLRDIVKSAGTPCTFSSHISRDFSVLGKVEGTASLSFE